MPVHIIFLTDQKGIEAVRMLWFEVLPPFALHNFIPKTNHDEKKTDFKNTKDDFDNSSLIKVFRFQAEFVDIDEVMDKFANKTLTMQKYFNHPKEEVEYREDNENPLSVIYYEVKIIIEILAMNRLGQIRKTISKYN